MSNTTIALTILAILAALGLSYGALGHGMADAANQAEKDDHTAREEAEGEALWAKLQAKEATCGDLKDDDFGALGEYFMGRMMGNAHTAMNAMITQVHGESGEKQIHIVMGKRLSGCDTSAAFPAESLGWMPMMNMMFPLRQGFEGQVGSWPTNNMMNFGTFGFFGWIFMILWWILITAAVVALIKWLINQFRRTAGGTAGQSALDALKKRYARGEITKDQFEEIKRDIG